MMLDLFLKNMKFIFDPGISADLMAFFSGDPAIEDYTISTSSNCYIVKVWGRKTDKESIGKIMHEFILFMEYSLFTYYRKTLDTDGVSYDFITGYKEDEGFYCRVIFMTPSV